MDITELTRPQLIEAVAITDDVVLADPPDDLVTHLLLVNNQLPVVAVDAPAAVVRSYLAWRDRWCDSVAVDFADELALVFGDAGEAGEKAMETMGLREANDHWIALERPRVMDFGAALADVYQTLEDRGLQLNGMLMVALNRVVGYGMKAGTVYLGPAIVEPIPASPQG